MKKVLYIILIAVTLACNEKPKEETTTTPAANNLIFITKAQFSENNMQLGKPEKHNFYNYITANGFIDVPPQNMASIHTFMAGYVKKSPLLIGDKVQQGALLLTLENPEYVTIQQNYMEVFKKLDYLKSEYQRQEQLYKEQISSEKVYLNAKSNYDIAMATYSGLKKKIQLMNLNPKQVEAGTFTSVIPVYAPISGTVAKLHINVGSYVSPTDELMEIVNNDHIHLELSVFEKDILGVQKGLPVRFKVPEASEKTFEAEVHLVGNTISAEKTVPVHGHIKNEKSLNFTVGMYINAKIVTDSTAIMAIPATGVSNDDENYYIYVLQNNDDSGYYFKKELVKTTRDDESYIAVPDAFANKMLLTSGAPML